MNHINSSPSQLKTSVRSNKVCRPSEKGLECSKLDISKVLLFWTTRMSSIVHECMRLSVFINECDNLYCELAYLYPLMFIALICTQECTSLSYLHSWRISQLQFSRTVHVYISTCEYTLNIPLLYTGQFSRYQCRFSLLTWRRKMQHCVTNTVIVHFLIFLKKNTVFCRYGASLQSTCILSTALFHEDFSSMIKTDCSY